LETERDIEAALLRRLQVAAIVEASTLLLLFCLAVPLKHVWGWPLGVKVIGPVHGLAFTGYAVALLQSIGAGMWRRGEIGWLALSAFVPFAGFRTWMFFARRAAALDTHRLER
jgi:integral membrane protein